VEAKRESEFPSWNRVKSEIRNIKLDCPSGVLPTGRAAMIRQIALLAVQSKISDFGFEMQDSSNFKIFSRVAAAQDSADESYATCRADQ
jgi:hypothetical protein